MTRSQTKKRTRRSSSSEEKQSELDSESDEDITLKQVHCSLSKNKTTSTKFLDLQKKVKQRKAEIMSIRNQLGSESSSSEDHDEQLSPPISDVCFVFMT